MKKNAFTMMELLIVIVILGLLSALVLPDIFGKSAQAKKDLTCMQLKSIEEAVKSFKSDNGSYPTVREGLNVLLENPSKEKYPNYNEVPYLGSKSVPKDSWKKEFTYIIKNDEFDVISFGADQKEGGEGIEADFGIEDCKK